jgi:hypothetical protein
VINLTKHHSHQATYKAPWQQAKPTHCKTVEYGGSVDFFAHQKGISTSSCHVQQPRLLLLFAAQPCTAPAAAAPAFY